MLLDECDDVFTNNSRLAQALLTELEKARCVVILATNKPVDLDPAMERRIAMKVFFPIPDAAQRLQIWHSLIPEVLALAPDVDLGALAERYQFSGGLIKNAVLLAAGFASRGNWLDVRVKMAHLERAAELQVTASPGEEAICRRYNPRVAVADLPLRVRDKEELQGAALAWQQLRGDGTGLIVLIGAVDVGTGVRAAEALAHECGLGVRAFNYARLQSSTEADAVLDPLSQRKVRPIEYAFSENIGASAMTIFVDHAGSFEQMIGSKLADQFYLNELLDHLRSHLELFCMVTRRFRPQPLPVEFHLHFALEYPPESVQVSRWEERLGNDELRENDLVALAARRPMHGGEIDFMARQARVLAAIRGGGRPGIKEVLEVIGRYRGPSGRRCSSAGGEAAAPARGSRDCLGRRLDNIRTGPENPSCDPKAS